MSGATVVFKLAASSVMGVVRFLLGGNKGGVPDRELGPHALWMRAAAACSVENLSGRVSVAEAGHVSLPEPAGEEPWR